MFVHYKMLYYIPSYIPMRVFLFFCRLARNLYKYLSSAVYLPIQIMIVHFIIHVQMMRIYYIYIFYFNCLGRYYSPGYRFIFSPSTGCYVGHQYGHQHGNVAYRHPYVFYVITRLGKARPCTSLSKENYITVQFPHRSVSIY